jgi:hypothetical protein
MTMAIMYIGQITSFFRATFSTKPKRDTMIDEFQRLNLYLKMTSPLAPIEGTTKRKTFSDKEILSITIQDLTFAYPKVSSEELAAYEIMIKRLQAYGSKKITSIIKDKISFMQDAFEEVNKPSHPVLKQVLVLLRKGTYMVLSDIMEQGKPH